MTEPTRSVIAADMPDQCHDGCKNAVIYWPFRWDHGVAHYQCGAGHTWTCSWGHDESGEALLYRGRPAVPETEAERLAQIARTAREIYRAEHPEPKAIDFGCAQCRAQPGEPCVWRTGASLGAFHASRADKEARAHHKYRVAVSNAGYRAQERLG